MTRRLLRVAPVIMLVILIVGCNAKTVSTEKEISDVITKDLGARRAVGARHLGETGS